jgi:plasmid stabilization system protein ParE
MAYEIKWTILANESHGNIADYLINEWSEKELKNFINAVEEKLQLIAIYPDLFQRTNKRKHIHKVIISKQVILFYRKQKAKNAIELLIFWDTRRNPTKLKLS